MSNVSVCVMGLGTVGLPTATYLQEAGYEVIGYDVNPKAVVNAKNLTATYYVEQIPKDIDVFVICVSTMQRDGRPNVSNVYDACAMIADEFQPKLISVESTVSIGTCRRIHATILKKDTNLAHVPHRYWPEDPQRHGVTQLRVSGAVDVQSIIETRKFYGEAGIPLIDVEPIEIAEMSKIVENAYRYVQISFAEELRRICDLNDVNFNTLRNACNSKWNIEIPEARKGIGGTCLPKDIRYLIDAARRKELEPDLLLAAIQADRKYVENLAEQMCYI